MLKALTVCLLVVAEGNAQVVQFQPGTPTALNSVDTGFAAIPAGTSPTLLPFTVDPSPNGGDLFDVYVGNPQVNISLVLPSSVEVNANNAASMGFGYVPAQIAAPGKLDLSIIGRVGYHRFYYVTSGAIGGHVYGEGRCERDIGKYCDECRVFGNLSGTGRAESQFSAVSSRRYGCSIGSLDRGCSRYHECGRYG